MEVHKNAASNQPPLSLEDAQKIVSSLNGIFDMMVTFIRKHESPMDNQGRNDPCLNPVAGTYCNNHEKKQEEINSEEESNDIRTNDARNVANTSTINTDNSRDNIKRKEINHGTLKNKRCHDRKGGKKSRKLSGTNITGETHVNTVNLLAENKQVTKVVTTWSRADGEKSECRPSLKRKSTDNATCKKRRLAEVVAQKIVNSYVSNKENGNPNETGGGFGVEIDCEISEEVDVTDETHQQPMKSDNLNKMVDENNSRDIIEISDDEDDSRKAKNTTTVKVFDTINKKTNDDIDGDTLDKLRILNDITIKPARSILKNVSISTNPSVSSVAPSTSPLSASKPVQPGTSYLSDQKPVVSLSHVITPLNLAIPKNTEILVTSRSSAPSLTSNNSRAHTSTSKPSPQRSTLSPQPPSTSLLTPGTIIPCHSFSMNLLPSSTPSKIPILSSPCPILVADKPSAPIVNQRKYLSAVHKLATRGSQLLTSTLARCDSEVAIQPVPSCTSFPFEALSHLNTPLNLPLIRSELSVTSISSLQKFSTQSHIASSRRESTRSNSPAEGSIHPQQPPKTWHTPVTLASETTSHTTSNTSAQGRSPAASSSETYSLKQTTQRSASAHSVILSNPEVSITSKSPIQKHCIHPNSFDSMTAFGERSSTSSQLIEPQVTKAAIPSVQRVTTGRISRKSRSNFPAGPPPLFMPNPPTIPTHPEIVHQARPNLLPGAALDVTMGGIPALSDSNFATNQAIHNIVTEYYYNSLLMSLPCLPNEIIRGLVSATFEKGS